MEENVTYEVYLNDEQFAEIISELQDNSQQTNDNLQAVNTSIGYATTFLILLVVFQFYGLLSRARKKGGA